MTTTASPIEYVEWQDSCSVSGGPWARKDDVDEGCPSKIESVGFIRKETKTFIIMAAHISPNQCSGDMCIPKSAITKRMKIKLLGK